MSDLPNHCVYCGALEKYFGSIRADLDAAIRKKLAEWVRTIRHPDFDDTHFDHGMGSLSCRWCMQRNDLLHYLEGLPE
jgi:hypothetical protein